MGKFRSKLKGTSKAKRWRKGQSSSSNPTITKFRDMAKSRFFNENLGGNNGLTTEALKKHNAIHIFGHGLGDIKKSSAESELSLSKSLQEVSLYDEATEDDNESGVASFKSFQTFASDWSACSNASFTRLLKSFDPKCALHKEMLAILAAITEVIKEKGGSETSTEYYAALMETLKVSETDEGITATISLLSMGLKTVPQAVLRKQFSEASEVFLDLLEKYSDAENSVILRCVLSCLSVFLRAQDYASWELSSTMKIFESILVFTIHSKPKIRKGAQHCVCAILRGSCFMLSDNEANKKVKLHPASNKVAAMCISQMKAEALVSNHVTVMHILTFLTEVLPYFSKECIKSCCESLLSLMTQNDIIVKTWCLKALYSLFVSSNESSQLTSTLTIQLIRALISYRPNALDNHQIIAWITVIEHAFIRLAKLDLVICMMSLPNFVHICVSELWLCDNIDVISTTSNALKAILMECVKPACETEGKSKTFWNNMESIFKSIKTGLDNPFNQSTKQVVLTIATCFEAGSEYISELLMPLLIHLNERRESHNFTFQKEMEYTTGCAVKYMGPEFVLDCIPLQVTSDSLCLDRSWLLIILKEKIQNSSLKFFADKILTLASLCRKKSKSASTSGDEINAHTYELLCGQLWALLPNFCNNATDIKDNFKNIARTLGAVLKDNADFRPSVMQGLRKLILTANDKPDDIEEIARFAKNFMPLLLNIYLTPVKGSHAEGQRLAAFETIQVYLTITPETLCQELYENALFRLEKQDDMFSRDALLDIMRILVLYQNQDKIMSLFDKWIFPLCENDSEELKRNLKRALKPKEEVEVKNSKEDIREKIKRIDVEHKKSYRILEEIFKSDKENCKLFLIENRKRVQKMLMHSLQKCADSAKSSRLRCIQHLIKLQPHLDHDSKLIKSVLPEAILCTKDINSKCRQSAFNLINTIGEILQTKPEGLDHFTAMLESGLQGTSNITTATIWCLASATYNFSAALGIQNLQRIMENVCQLMKTTDRQVVGACVAFLKVYSKSLPSPIVAGSLPIIFKSIAEMHDDCKRHIRTDLSNLLIRLMRKYGAETIGRLIPETDEGMHRKLRYVRKMDSRKKRIREEKRAMKMNKEELEDEIHLKGSSKTLEDILKDSDSELEMDDDDDAQSKRKPKSIRLNKKTNKMWIQEDEDNILDLMDPSSVKSIIATKPTQEDKGIVGSNNTKKSIREIKTTPDGKLILDFNDSESEEKEREQAISDDSDTGDDVSTAETMLLSAGKKRKYDDIRSNKSGKSYHTSKSSNWSTHSKTRSVHKGIHRKISKSAKLEPGSEYRSKKAKGDMKQKGKPDPYAYLPLIRNAMNKRKHKKHTGQFKNIMGGAQKGARTGKILKAKLKLKTKK